jgi:hypothetical protein
MWLESLKQLNHVKYGTNIRISRLKSKRMLSHVTGMYECVRLPLNHEIKLKRTLVTRLIFILASIT